jgi:type IV fimbrial biogenesis protein FimT
MKRNTGFTLIELMITIVLAVIVLTLAAPSFQDMIRTNRLATQTNQFISALNLARSEAIKRGVRVTVCRSGDQANCGTGAFEDGWIVFIDPNNNATMDFGEQIINVAGAAAGEIGIAGNVNVADFVSYTADGISRLPSGAFQAGTFEIRAKSHHEGRNVIINSTGRVRTEKVEVN